MPAPPGRGRRLAVTAPPASTVAVTPRSRRRPSLASTISRARTARSTGSGLRWSGAASACVSSPSWPITPDSPAAATRAFSSCAASAGTTPSTMACTCDSSTVAGVARSCARSLAARRRSASERSSRSAMPLKAVASSADSASGPPRARAVRSPCAEPPGRARHLAQRPRQPVRGEGGGREHRDDGDRPR